MKKLLAFILIPFVLFVFAGCATNKTEEVDEETEVIEAEEQQAPLEKEVKNQPVLQNEKSQPTVESTTETTQNCAYHGDACPYDNPNDCPEHTSLSDGSHSGHGNGHHAEHE